MKNNINPAVSKLTLLGQICNLIPPHLTSKVARETGAEDLARSFSPWSHVVSLIYGQLTHAFGLNDVCDGLQLHSGPLSAIRGATPPSRNGLSNANKVRPASMAEKLFWRSLEHLQNTHQGFGRGRLPGRLRRFKRAIHIVDSTVMELVAACLDWAKHRRRKAAAKCHLRLDLQSLLPRFVLVDTAREHDNHRAVEVCAGVKSGEIIVFDRAYVDQAHFAALAQRGVVWVTRCKENLVYDLLEKLEPREGGSILKDEIIALSRGVRVRRIEAWVEVDGEQRQMSFLTNQFEWSAQTVADLYRCRWEIEVFFKQIKQTLQLSDFLGNSANAVRWQVYTALLVFLLLRFMAWQSQWGHSFLRIFTLVRAGLWKKVGLYELLKCYGTAGGSFRALAQPQQAYFAGF